MAKVRSFLIAAWLAWGVGAAAVGAAPPSPPAVESSAGPAAASAAEALLRELADRLLDEAERQHTVNRRMDTSVRGLDGLVRDLLSNDLLAQGKGPQMKRFVQVLGLLASRHVPNAEQYLQEARKRLEAYRPHVAAADGEIQIIVRMLDELLKKAENVRTEDDLVTQLRLIIRKEENLHEQTRQWGKLLYQDAQKAEGSREELKGRQEQVAANVRQFEQRLNEVARSETDPLRRQDMAKASDAMKKSETDKLLDKAAEEIAAKKPVPAVQKQADALDKLRELEKLLEGQIDDAASQLQQMKDSYQQLSDILERQEKLTQKTEQTAPKDFPQKAKEQQVEQRNIRNDLSEASKEMPEAADPEVKKPLDEAQQHMENADKAMEKTEQAPAVQEEKKAEEALKQALKKMEEQMAKLEEQAAQEQQASEMDQQFEQAIEQTESLLARQQQLSKVTQQSTPQQLGQLTQPQKQLSSEAAELSKEAQPLAENASDNLQEAASQMQQAAEAMEQGQKPDAQQHQQQAMAALQQAAKQLHQAQQQAQAQAQPQPNPQPQPTKTNNPKELGSRNFGRQKPAGRLDDDKKLWDHLNPREREALRQRFARELPLEYRELLEDYYEALSK